VKTTIDIPDAVMEEAMRFTGASTKRDAVVSAVEEFNRRHRLKELAERLHGACPDFMDRNALDRMREGKDWGEER
jgi:Arc/MetJ family transcription regulator